MNRMSCHPHTRKPSDVHDEPSAQIETLQVEHLGARSKQDKEKAELVDRSKINRIRNDFPNEVKEIFKLRPLRTLANDDKFLDILGKIIYRNRTQADNSTKQAASSTIQSVDQAVEIIDLVKKGIQGLDIAQLKSSLNLANQLLPGFFPEGPGDFAELMHRFQAMLLVLSLALTLATGVSQLPRKRGRRTSEHVLPAIELIQLWEHVTAERLQEGVQVRRIEPVPTPKKDKGTIGQSSTEFVRIALQMISPGITDSQVFTAIKHALLTQREFYKLLPSDADLAKTMGAIFRMNERASFVRKKPASKRL